MPIHRFEIGTAGQLEFVRVRGLQLADFEDAVVCAVAQARDCDSIVTRNLGDFSKSPVRAMSPEEFLVNLEGFGQED